MTTRNFDSLFRPRAIALIGASDRPGSVGDVVARNLKAGGFPGPLMFVNPKGKTILGETAFRSVADLPHAPDLAVIATPAPTLPGLVSDLGARGCRAAVVISAGFEAQDEATARLRQALLDAARPHLLRIVGPNCLGFMSPRRGINASFARGSAPPGGVALVAQSGAVASALLDWAPAHGVGFSHVVTLGNALDVDVADMLDHLGRDPETKAILLYLEGLREARKFMSAARFAARSKPVVVIKGGRGAAGAKAAFSHTGALAGADAVYAAAFRRAGLLQVAELSDFLEAAETFARGHPRSVERLAIVTNGGGAGVLAVDALEREGAPLAELSPQTIEALGRVAPANWSRRNPVDILGDTPAQLYGEAVSILAAAPEVDAILAINCPTAVTDSTEAAEAVIAATPRGWAPKPVLTAWLGGASVAQARARFTAEGLPTYETPEAAVRAFALKRDCGHARERLLHAPDGSEGAGDMAAARAVVEGVLAEGRSSLAPLEIQAVLRAYGVPILETRIVRDPTQAGEAAEALGGPVALKILSRDIPHKSDVGGVRLDLEGRGPVERAAGDMLANVARLRPDAHVEGFMLQPMVVRPKAQEILAGIVQDPVFGPLVMVGAGGVAVEVLADRALGFPPLNEALAREMIGTTRISRLLAGFRDRPPADLAALAKLLVALGRLSTDVPEIVELDLNPVLCDESGAIALDARIAVRRPDLSTPRPAILPYPAHLTHQVKLGDLSLCVRPIRPADAERLVDMVDRSTDEDVHMRFFGGMRRLTPDLALRLTQIDYDRHMAFVAEAENGEILGVGRLVEDPEGGSGEYALMVRSDHQDRGLGRMLLKEVLDYADARGLGEVWGDVARENHRMRSMAEAFGFRTRTDESDLGRVRVVWSPAETV
ncbi:acetyl-CoA synthetase / acetyltransferase (GNAT) family protein [Phenylobacterium zucineum HLK1]|uniref:Acetyl-CoA synthetase / acetyltransferase (GNAT) family protein n=1 Tax=Phenylobacterium zucineum (strain HLK1) TaxID=450851 RepID=B4RED1_PHEZH|nr:bifunctional acetate--CoA ligase family protein/GNAT family N-acetyltransferase [Phenylobacterium zucineum]ACG76873.1 acetyl-CoA synthetase / acetyltransferase (GNAT) family protein [Phenylobacterium zucineum HLK1]